jgi:hypothetical protein
VPSANQQEYGIGYIFRHEFRNAQDRGAAFTRQRAFLPQRRKTIPQPFYQQPVGLWITPF